MLGVMSGHASIMFLTQRTFQICNLIGQWLCCIILFEGSAGAVEGTALHRLGVLFTENVEKHKRISQRGDVIRAKKQKMESSDSELDS